MGACHHVPPASAFLVSRELQAPEAVITPLGPRGRWVFAFRSSPRSELFFVFVIACGGEFLVVSAIGLHCCCLLRAPHGVPSVFCLCSY